MNDVSGSRFCVSGVGTQMITAPTSRTTSKSVDADSRLVARPAAPSSSSVTSPTYEVAGLICATLAGSGSTHTTVVPVSANRTASGRPTYPAPITATSHVTRHTVAMTLLTDDQSERFQVVDADDREVGVRTRAECHADRALIHRSVFVCVETPAGTIFQRRGLGKDSNPGWWCLACAGHVGRRRVVPRRRRARAAARRRASSAPSSSTPARS